MSGLDTPHFYFELFILSYVLGATAIVALTVTQTWPQALFTFVFSMFGTSLFDASGPHFLFLGIPGGNLFGATALAMAVLFSARYGISHNPNFSGALRRILVPHLWDQADTSPATLADYSKRWYVTVAAATGSVVGVVIADPEIIDVICKAFSANQVFYTLFLTVVSITLIGPGEELAMGWSRRSSDGGKEDERPSPFEELFQRFSVHSLGSVLLVALAWLVLNIVHKRMDDALSTGKFETASIMLFACVPTGIVTYYWCAALQRGVPSVARTAARASAMATGLLLFPYATFALVDGVIEAIKAIIPMMAYAKPGAHSGWGFLLQGPAAGLLGILLIVIIPILAAAAALILSGILYGVIAYLGGVVLDRDKNWPDRASAVTIVWLVLFLMLWNGLLAWLAYNWADRQHIIEHRQWLLSSYYFLGGDVVWGIGLWISGFPKIVEHARARSSGAHGKARTAPH